MSSLTLVVGHLWLVPVSSAAVAAITYGADAWRWRKSRWLRSWEAAQRERLP
jgi:hypothetical protein